MIRLITHEIRVRHENIRSEIVVLEPMIYEGKKACSVVDKAQKEIDQPFMSSFSLGASGGDSGRMEEYFYYRKVLFQDNKFMKAVQEIYDGRHKVFERGYSMLTTNN